MSDKIPSPFLLAGVAALTGLFLGITAGIIAVLLGVKPWAWGFGVFSLTALFGWLGLLAWWRSLVESLHGIKQPEQRTEPYKITVVAEDPSGAFQEGHFLDCPISEEALKRACRVLAEGGSFSHASLAGPHKPLSRSEYEALRDTFIKAGLAYWKTERGHSQGLALTRVGLHVVRHIAKISIPPSPRGAYMPIDRNPERYPHAYTRTHAPKGEDY